MGRFYTPLLLLFCFAIAITQAWLCQRRFDRTTYIWIGMSLLGLFVSYFGASAVMILLIFAFRLDVLQNSQQAALAVAPTAIIFVINLITSQWLIFREIARRPIRQASLNVILGMGTWLLLSLWIFRYEDVALALPLFVVLLVVLGAGVGGIIHIILN
jgi:hypothetical protein